MADGDSLRPVPSVKYAGKSAVAFSPVDGLLWTAEEKDLRSWNLDELTLHSEWSNTASAIKYGHSSLTCLRVAPEGVYVGSRDGFLKRFSEDGQGPVQEWQVGPPIYSFAVDATHSLALVGTLDGQIHLVRLGNDGHPTSVAAHSRRINAVEFYGDDDELVATASDDGKVHLWRLRTAGLEKILTIQSPTGRPVNSVKFSPHGSTLGVLGHCETALRMWDMDRLRETLSELGLGW